MRKTLIILQSNVEVGLLLFLAVEGAVLAQNDSK